MFALLQEFTDVFHEPRGLPPAYQREHHIHHASCKGIIRNSASVFSAPVLLVKKHDGTWRFYVDYPRGANLFYKFDLRSGFHQVLMRGPDVHKTVFRTHHSHFEFLVMPFGLTNAPTTFQAIMNAVLKPFLCCFVRERLFLKQSKCAFGANSISYLVHVMSGASVAMDPAKISAVQE
ncbi:hypothetical protein E2562_025503 [Oryza meyeriana var. granulata]|uniref:Reverse transcriptase domain-containing protein n=1 Tax=Oryza meyeriana var. granulata TaxID=110450 RepID=A0A6G1CK05_9ORYZ|nr:hypothetical protein E2562_025503 [Oryza meyeriana var. granulata]